MKISVIIPMYNEEEIVADTVEALNRQLNADFGNGEYEMLFVDDGSQDKCAEKANSLCPGFPAMRVLEYLPNRGKGYAVRTGMLEAKGEFVLFTDCDLAYGTEIIRAFYDEFIRSGADIIIGSRTLDKSGYDGYTFKRKVMSKAYIKYLNIVAGFKHSDSQCGIKGFSSSAAKTVFSKCKCDRWAFDLEALLMAENMQLKIAEKSVKIINHRDSKINPIHDAIQMTKEVRKIKKQNKALKK